MMLHVPIGKNPPPAFNVAIGKNALMTRRAFLGVAAASVGVLAASFTTGCTDFDASGSGNDARTITDMAGREVSVPQHIESVYSTGQPGVVSLYILAPDKLLGWCMKPSSVEAEYLEQQYLDLPVLGLMQGQNNTANREEIISRAPDAILLMTSLQEDADRESAVGDADAIARKMGIPTVVADYSLKATGEAFRFLGDLLDCEQRAEDLASYCDRVYANALVNSASIADADRVRVYYAQGQSGLQTAPQGSEHSEVLDLVGADNVVKLEAGSGGRVNVDMEQVLIWNPKVIVTSYAMSHSADGQAVFTLIEEGNKSWSEVSAVRSGSVYNTPAYPFNWQDMPPSANRIIGISWLGNLLYPELFDIDIRKETQSFYQLFYRVELSDVQLEVLLVGAIR